MWGVSGTVLHGLLICTLDIHHKVILVSYDPLNKLELGCNFFILNVKLCFLDLGVLLYRCFRNLSSPVLLILPDGVVSNL